MVKNANLPDLGPSSGGVINHIQAPLVLWLLSQWSRWYQIILLGECSRCMWTSLIWTDWL